MRKIFKYIYLLPFFLVASCTFSEGLSLDEVLKVSNTTFEFDKSATSQTLEIESYISWEASTDAEWIEISPKSGLSGVTTMILTVYENTSVESRSSVIKIVNSEYGIEQEILVVQSEFVPELKVNVEKLENISYNGSTEEIKIESNISWEASVNADWINLYPKIGNTGVTLMQIEISKNVLKESREAEIILKNEEYSLTAKVKIIQNPYPKISGHEYVDLGLPSGLKWATCNVGASSPEEYGDYYAWGEIDTKSEYTKDNSKTYGKSMSDISGNSTYDVARAKWGGSWRLPTKDELEELASKCTWLWTTQNGRKGYKVIGPNRNSIFLPAAGYRYESSLLLAGRNADYWSSTPLESDDGYAYSLLFNSSHHSVAGTPRLHGQSVRPVSE